MAQRSTPIFVLCLLFLHVALPSAQEVADEREFEYAEGAEKGPQHWGELKPEWEACKNGSMQSPIDMSSQRVTVIFKSGEIKRRYKPCDATLRNRGHDISLQWEGDAGLIRINGTSYSLQQAHWHSPSEHSINGRRYDLELHMVHMSNDTTVKHNTAVVGLFYKIGRPDAFLAKLSKQLKWMVNEKGEREMGMIDPREIKMGGRKYYRYIGSLTVPPCTEGVIWTINKRIRTVSREQIRLLREAVHDYAENNARPLQPLNGRKVELYGPNPRTGNT